MSEFGLTHFLVTVRFVGPQGTATRHVYHVARVGDHVSLPADDHVEGETYWIVVGTVQSVLWMDDYILATVTMGEELDAQVRKERGMH